MDKLSDSKDRDIVNGLKLNYMALMLCIFNEKYSVNQALAYFKLNKNKSNEVPDYKVPLLPEVEVLNRIKIKVPSGLKKPQVRDFIRTHITKDMILEVLFCGIPMNKFAEHIGCSASSLYTLCNDYDIDYKSIRKQKF